MHACIHVKAREQTYEDDQVEGGWGTGEGVLIWRRVDCLLRVPTGLTIAICSAAHGSEEKNPMPSNSMAQNQKGPD